MLLALAAIFRIHYRRLRLRRGLVIAGAVCMCMPLAWVGILFLTAAALTLGLHLLDEPPLLLASIGLVSTAIIHAIFFGGARYAIVTMPWTIALAGCVWRRKSVG